MRLNTMFFHKLKAACLFAAVCAASFVLVGCADFGGGSVVVPDVTFLPANLSGGDTSSGSGTPADEPQVATSGGGPGSFSGRVVLTGGGRKLPPLFVKDADIKDKEVCSRVDVPDERLILSDDNGVQNVFVFMKKAPKGGPKMTPSTELLEFDQEYCRFLPHCMIVPVGQTVKVLSRDSIAHNTHTNPAKNNSLSNLVPPNDREGALRLTYTRAEEPFSVTCDFHTWMNAYHLPLDHPYGAVTDENGHFEIKDVPSGTHDFVVWHESATGKYIQRKLKVTITAGAVTDMKIDYPAAKLSL